MEQGDVIVPCIKSYKINRISHRHGGPIFAGSHTDTQLIAVWFFSTFIMTNQIDTCKVKNVEITIIGTMHGMETQGFEHLTIKVKYKVGDKINDTGHIHIIPIVDTEGYLSGWEQLYLPQYGQRHGHGVINKMNKHNKRSTRKKYNSVRKKK